MRTLITALVLVTFARQGADPMETAYLVLNIFRMPLPGPPFPRAPYRYSNCGHIIAYHSGRAELVS